MKRFLPVLLITLLAVAGTAFANADADPAEKSGERVLRAEIIDKDPNGTNLRATPGGKVIYTIPLKPKDEMERYVDVYEQKGDWFRVTIAESDRGGWMHSSVLGLRGGAAEDGPCPFMKTPSYDGKVVFRPKETGVLQLLGITRVDDTNWFLVRRVDAKNAKYEGWIPQQCE